MTFLDKTKSFGIEFISRVTPFWIASKFLPKKFIVYGHLISDGYHPVSRRYQYPTFSEFGSFIKEFKALGYKFSSVEDYMKEDDCKKILLTFDDGFKSIFDQLHPYMIANDLPYAIFILTDPLNDPDYHVNPITHADVLENGRIFLSMTELLKLKEEGVYIGFHTRSHFLIGNDYSTDDVTIEKQLSIPSEFLNLFSEPMSFAYPFFAPQNYKPLEEKFVAQFDYFFDTKGFFETSGKHHFRVSLDTRLGESREIRVSIKRQLTYFTIKRWNKRW